MLHLGSDVVEELLTASGQVKYVLPRTRNEGHKVGVRGATCPVALVGQVALWAVKLGVSGCA